MTQTIPLPPARVPELLAPAGSLNKVRMALAYGADAVYVGAAGLSMRPDGASLTVDDLRLAAGAAHAAGKRLYVAVNTLLFEDDIAPLSDWLSETADVAFDAVIVSDPGALDMIRRQRPRTRLHISTQSSTANHAAAAFWKRAGAQRVVLARECTLDQAREISEAADIETEVFVHGAMCVAVSGRCLLSAHLCGSSASKGECKHSCRWEWQLVEQKRPGETLPVFETGRQTIFLGSTDLCLIDHIPALVRSGVSSLKIEGRMKSELYVATVTRTYRAALDRYAADPQGYRTDPEWVDTLNAVSHRPYSTGFAFGYPSDAPETMQTHNRPVSTRLMVATVEEEQEPGHRVTVKNPFKPGDVLEWMAPSATGTATVEHILSCDDGTPIRAIPGTQVVVQLQDTPRLPAATILLREDTRQRG